MNNSIIVYIARIFVLITAIPVHESAHGLVSYWLGDPTAKLAGRITLNPLKHFDPIGSICLIIGGIGWAKPVPIDTRYFHKPKRDMAISAIAGPISNFIMGFAALLILKTAILFLPLQLLGKTTVNIIFTLLYTMVTTNIMLAIFNMMPFPPFDGSRIYLTFLPQKWYFEVMKYEKYIMAVVFILLFTSVLDKPLGFVYQTVIQFLDNATGYLGKLF